MAKKFDSHLSENAFAKAEQSMMLDKAGNGSFGFDLHGSKTRSGRIQSPAQHAAVKKAAAASVAKRRSRVF